MHFGDLGFESAHLGLEQEDPPHACDGETLTSQAEHMLDVVYLLARVATMVTVRAHRTDDLFGIEAAKERWLHAEHPADLPHCVDRRVLVVEHELRGRSIESLSGIGNRADPTRSWLEHRVKHRSPRFRAAWS